MGRLTLVTEMARNQLIRVPAVRARARRSHYTGIQSQTGASEALLEHLTSLLPWPLPGLKVLEVGPGSGTEMMRLMTKAGVGTYAAFDVERYLEPEDLPDPAIDYRTGTDGVLPWEADTFDLVWSHSVMEHVRDPRGVQAEIQRVLKPSGRQFAGIDFKDHLQDRTDPAGMYDMLSYTSRTWDLMTSHRSTWVNRLRYSDWIQLFTEAGFVVEQVVPEHDHVDLEAFRTLSYLDRYSDEDLLNTSASFVLAPTPVQP